MGDHDNTGQGFADPLENDLILDENTSTPILFLPMVPYVAKAGTVISCSSCQSMLFV